jgi:hypothetical protein
MEEEVVENQCDKPAVVDEGDASDIEGVKQREYSTPPYSQVRMSTKGASSINLILPLSLYFAY